MSVHEHCRLCGGARRLEVVDFTRHVATEQHRAALRAWEHRHASSAHQGTGTHHEGHVALRIACACFAQEALDV